MAHSPRIEWFLKKANLNPPLRLTSLTTPPSQDFLPFDSSNCDIAHNILVQTRICSPNYISPESQKWHFIRSKDQKAKACDMSNWTFTKHEVARAFDTLLDQPILPPAGVAQALLMHTSVSSMDELWGHLNDATMEKRTKRHRLSQSLGEFDATAMTWLDKTVSRNNVNYIHLLCQTQVNQTALDRALGIALSKSSLQAIKLLLSFGAVASRYHEAVDEQIRARNLELVELLLSAPDAMDLDKWRICLEKEFARTEAEETFSAVAIVLAYASCDELFSDIHDLACQLVCHYEDDDDRLSVFSMLFECGLIKDSPVVREELVRDVRVRHIPLIKLLIQVGVVVDDLPHGALQLVVSQLDFELMETLARGRISSPPTQLLGYLPNGVTEQELVEFATMFDLVDQLSGGLDL
ncbi:hypothetical protein ACLX1H_005488 [Fusarium chlamydosporum]